jgi:hypothetical protein
LPDTGRFGVGAGLKTGVREGETMSTMTDVETEILDNEDFHTCDYESCQRRATHRGFCPVCPAFEYFCIDHVAFIRDSYEGKRGIFSKACNHSVENRDIRFEPIG